MWTICDWVESVLLLKKIVSSSNSDLFLYDIEASVRQEREKGEERKEEVGDSPFVVQLEVCLWIIFLSFLIFFLTFFPLSFHFFNFFLLFHIFHLLF